MEQQINEIKVNGVDYIRKDSVKSKNLLNVDGLPVVMIRTYSAGVHYGILKKRESTLAGIEVELLEARRIWSWSGAASLSQLAMEGTSKPEKCKFPCKVRSIELVAIEIIPMTDESVNSLNNVKIWNE